jgi:hypothetical protein
VPRIHSWRLRSQLERPFRADDNHSAKKALAAFDVARLHRHACGSHCFDFDAFRPPFWLLAGFLPYLQELTVGLRSN